MTACGLENQRISTSLGGLPGEDTTRTPNVGPNDEESSNDDNGSATGDNSGTGGTSGTTGGTSGGTSGGPGVPDKLVITNPQNNSTYSEINIPISGECSQDIAVSGDNINAKTIMCTSGTFADIIQLIPDNNIEDYQIIFQSAGLNEMRVVKYQMITEFIINTPTEGMKFSNGMINTQGSCENNVMISGDLAQSLTINCVNNEFNSNIEINLQNGKTNYQLIYDHGTEQIILNLVYEAPKSDFEKFWEVYNFDPPGTAQSCAACHNVEGGFFPYFGNSAESFQSTITDSEDSGVLKGLPLVVGGKPELSSLYTRIIGSKHLPQGSKSNMPLGASNQTFSNEQIQLIEDWIKSLPVVGGEGNLTITSPQQNQELMDKVFNLSGTCISNYPVKITGPEIIDQNFLCPLDGVINRVITLENENEGNKLISIEQVHYNKSASLVINYKKNSPPPPGGSGNYTDEVTGTFTELKGGLKLAHRHSIAKRLLQIFGMEVFPLVQKNILFEASTYGQTFDFQAAGENGNQNLFYQMPANRLGQIQYADHISINALQPALLLQTCMSIEKDYANNFMNPFTLAGMDPNAQAQAGQIQALLKVFYAWENEFEADLLNIYLQYYAEFSSALEANKAILNSICGSAHYFY
jgi:hypothetical protein